MIYASLGHWNLAIGAGGLAVPSADIHGMVVQQLSQDEFEELTSTRSLGSNRSNEMAQMFIQLYAIY